MRYAVLSNPAAYEPQFEYTAPRDFYVMDLQNFEKKLFLKNIRLEPHSFNASPAGTYFAYFKNGDWWAYNFSTGIHKNITDKIGNKFTAKEVSLVPESVCGSPGWTKNDSKYCCMTSLIYGQ